MTAHPIKDLQFTLVEGMGGNYAETVHGVGAKRRRVVNANK